MKYAAYLKVHANLPSEALKVQTEEHRQENNNASSSPLERHGNYRESANTTRAFFFLNVLKNICLFEYKENTIQRMHVKYFISAKHP